MPGPLEGVKVLSFARNLAGPYCIMILCDLGAEVIKIEEPGEGHGRGSGASPGGKIEGNGYTDEILPDALLNPKGLPGCRAGYGRDPEKSGNAIAAPIRVRGFRKGVVPEGPEKKKAEGN